MILGVDEVGRGPWAGPLVVGAVVLPENYTIEGLTDSKKLTAKRRVALNEEIKKQALGWGLGWVDAAEIDSIGLSAALRVATIRAVQAVDTTYHEIIIDGTINFLKETSKGQYVTTMPKADLLVPAVSAASIIAKVARDTYMEQQDEVYPEYGFGSHVGYGTAKHAKALQEFGVTDLHRKSFAPIAKLLASSPQIAKPINVKSNSIPTTRQLGDSAEDLVETELLKLGYVIIQRNWKTKYCEIDIIAECEDTRYFVEVKYRNSNNQGGGVAAITPKKLQQMHFSAELFGQRYPSDKNQLLMVASLDADNSIELLKIT